MATMTKRRCRMCPTIFDGAGDADRCDRCETRSAAVREAVRPEPIVATPVRAERPRTRTCQQDGHHACGHFVALYVYFRDFVKDCGMCGVCSAEVGQGEDDVNHKPGCAFEVIHLSASPAPGGLGGECER